MTIDTSSYIPIQPFTCECCHQPTLRPRQRRWSLNCEECDQYYLRFVKTFKGEDDMAIIARLFGRHKKITQEYLRL